MTWSYANYGVPMLFGIPPVGSDVAAHQDYAQRKAAWHWLTDTPQTVTPQGCLVRRFGVEFVAGPVRIPGWKATYSRRLLAHSPNVRLVHTDHGINVYQVTAAGRACASSS